ncbi:MAG TPA: CARDB domain-containing protein [Solirubrobacteraceae bacterium]|nr:CARDB domain-containing protein [Solirubrobacteraceae bacterium]
MVRRALALGVGLLVVLLLVFGIRGCLDGRQEQALKDYNRDVSTVIQRADQTADEFYDTLSGATAPTGATAASTDVQSEINRLRTSAEQHTRRAEDLDVPGEMRPAHVNLLLSLSLVQEAIGKVAEKIPAALSTDSATAVPAVRGIAGEMRALDAADVVYNRRTAALVKQVLDDNEIGGQVIQSSSFLQNLGWMQPSTVARRINSQAGRGAGDGASTEAAPGTHGHGLIALSVGEVTLTPGEANSLTAGSNVTFNVNVANQGENPEQDVRVRVRITGADEPVRVEEVIDQTQPGTETTVPIRLEEPPPIGQPVTIRAEVLPVNGEKNIENNTLTFPAIFRRS